MTTAVIGEPARAQYNRWSARYDQYWRGYVSQTLHFLKGWAAITPTAAILDIACGTGAFAHLLLTEHPTQPIVGVDLSEQMLAIARQKCAPFPSATFQQARANALPFAAAQFDTVVTASAFHYFADPACALAEMQRVVRPGGAIIILDWCRDFLVCRLCDVALRLLDPAHRNCYTQAELHRLLHACGLTITQARRVRFGPIWGLMVATATTVSAPAVSSGA